MIQNDQIAMLNTTRVKDLFISLPGFLQKTLYPIKTAASVVIKSNSEEKSFILKKNIIPAAPISRSAPTKTV
jgi:hypothetical protein